jgi:hypothetical protein
MRLFHWMKLKTPACLAGVGWWCGAAPSDCVSIPGDTSARIISIEGNRGETLDIRPWQALFDLSLEASGEAWTGATDLLRVARFGHFTEESLPWEKVRFAPLTQQVAA